VVNSVERRVADRLTAAPSQKPWKRMFSASTIPMKQSRMWFTPAVVGGASGEAGGRPRGVSLSGRRPKWTAAEHCQNTLRAPRRLSRLRTSAVDLPAEAGAREACQEPDARRIFFGQAWSTTRLSEPPAPTLPAVSLGSSWLRSCVNPATAVGSADRQCNGGHGRVMFALPYRSGGKRRMRPPHRRTFSQSSGRSSTRICGVCGDSITAGPHGEAPSTPSL
jgi:hypothetical protein